MASENKTVTVTNDKEGYLYLHQEEKKSLKKFFCVCFLLLAFRLRHLMEIFLHMEVINVIKVKKSY